MSSDFSLGEQLGTTATNQRPTRELLRDELFADAEHDSSLFYQAPCKPRAQSLDSNNNNEQTPTTTKAPSTAPSNDKTTRSPLVLLADIKRNVEGKWTPLASKGRIGVVLMPSGAAADALLFYQDKDRPLFYALVDDDSLSMTPCEHEYMLIVRHRSVKAANDFLLTFESSSAVRQLLVAFAISRHHATPGVARAIVQKLTLGDASETLSADDLLNVDLEMHRLSATERKLTSSADLRSSNRTSLRDVLQKLLASDPVEQISTLILQESACVGSSFSVILASPDDLKRQEDATGGETVIHITMVIASRAVEAPLSIESNCNVESSGDITMPPVLERRSSSSIAERMAKLGRQTPFAKPSPRQKRVEHQSSTDSSEMASTFEPPPDRLTAATSAPPAKEEKPKPSKTPLEQQPVAAVTPAAIADLSSLNEKLDRLAEKLDKIDTKTDSSSEQNKTIGEMRTRVEELEDRLEASRKRLAQTLEENDTLQMRSDTARNRFAAEIASLTERLQRQSSAADSRAECDQSMKRLMNQLYRRCKQQFQPLEQYDGADIRAYLQECIREITAGELSK